MRATTSGGATGGPAHRHALAGVHARRFVRLRSAALGLLLPLLFIAAACGVQGPPLPPLLNLPEPAVLQSTAQGGQVVLSWAMPRMTTEAQAIRPSRLGSAEIYEAVIPGLHAAVPVAEFRARSEQIASLAPADLQKPSISYTVQLPAERAGSTAAFAVLLKNDHGHDAGFSNIVSFPILAPVAAPAQLTVEPGERSIRLEWAAVEGASAYEVYRAVNGGDFLALDEVPAGPNPVVYADPKFQFGSEYRYLVRAVRKEGEFRSESADSVVKAVKPADVFPPARPTGLVAMPGDGAVELSWEPNSESDLAGYNVYRSVNGQAAQRLNKETLVSSAFRDTQVPAGATCTYTVSALDQAGNESARSESVTAKR